MIGAYLYINEYVHVIDVDYRQREKYLQRTINYKQYFTNLLQKFREIDLMGKKILLHFLKIEFFPVKSISQSSF